MMLSILTTMIAYSLIPVLCSGPLSFTHTHTHTHENPSPVPRAYTLSETSDSNPCIDALGATLPLPLAPRKASKSCISSAKTTANTCFLHSVFKPSYNTATVTIYDHACKKIAATKENGINAGFATGLNVKGLKEAVVLTFQPGSGEILLQYGTSGPWRSTGSEADCDKFMEGSYTVCRMEFNCGA